jgi:Flp pilus assembly pilin Flp
MAMETANTSKFTKARGAIWQRAYRRMIRDQRGTTSLEWALLLGAIALPSVYLFTMSLGVIVDYYRMMTQFSSLPLP